MTRIKRMTADLQIRGYPRHPRSYFGKSRRPYFTSLQSTVSPRRHACAGMSKSFIMSPNQAIRIGIVTVSDRASRGEYEDRGGPAIRACLDEILACEWQAVPRLIADEQPLIETTLKELCDQENCCLVVTTGGTGPARRDVTPEATEA